MEANKALYRKYFPNSHISDADLTILLNSLVKYYPNKGLKTVFSEMQRDNAFWSKFRAKYPHADVHNFHLDNTDGVRNIYITVKTGLGVKQCMIGVLSQVQRIVH